MSLGDEQNLSSLHKPLRHVHDPVLTHKVKLITTFYNGWWYSGYDHDGYSSRPHDYGPDGTDCRDRCRLHRWWTNTSHYHLSHSSIAQYGYSSNDYNFVFLDGKLHAFSLGDLIIITHYGDYNLPVNTAERDVISFFMINNTKRSHYHYEISFIKIAIPQ